jgi:hypothetical protein
MTGAGAIGGEIAREWRDAGFLIWISLPLSELRS